MAVELFFVNVVHEAGIYQGWTCGGCGNFVHPGSEWLVFLFNPANKQQPIVPVLVHADCGQGIAHARKWEDWRLRLLDRDPDANLDRAMNAIKAAFKGWAMIDIDADVPRVPTHTAPG